MPLSTVGLGAGADPGRACPMSGMTWMWGACARLGGGEALGALGESWLHAAIARVITVAAAQTARDGRQRFTDSSWSGWMTRVQLRCQGDGCEFCGQNVDRARQVGRDSHGTCAPVSNVDGRCEQRGPILKVLEKRRPN